MRRGQPRNSGDGEFGEKIHFRRNQTRTPDPLPGSGSPRHAEKSISSIKLIMFEKPCDCLQSIKVNRIHSVAKVECLLRVRLNDTCRLVKNQLCRKSTYRSAVAELFIFSNAKTHHFPIRAAHGGEP